jgi:oligo-1,6-glucosidase
MHREVFTDPARRELDMVFQFEHVDVDRGASKWDVQPFDLRRLKASLGRWQEGLAERGWNSLYWCNHDQPRVVSRFGDDGAFRVRSATMLATVLHLHRGTPFVYQGEELGMANAPWASLADFRDLESLNHAAEAIGGGADPDDVLAALRARSRDNARTPVQWDASPHAGFTTGTPWLPVRHNHEQVNAAAQRDDPHSVLAHYRRLIALRHDEPVVAHGSFTMLLPEHEHVYAFLRRLGEVELLVLGSFSGEPLVMDLPDAAQWAAAPVLLSNLDVVPAPSEVLSLQPWEARVHRRATGGVTRPSGEQITLRYGDQRAVVVESGGGIPTYDVAGHAVLDGYDAHEMVTAPAGVRCSSRGRTGCTAGATAGTARSTSCRSPSLRMASRCTG